MDLNIGCEALFFVDLDTGCGACQMIGPGVVSWRVLQTGREALLLRVEIGRGAVFVG